VCFLLSCCYLTHSVQHLNACFLPPPTRFTQHLKNVGADGGEEALGSWPAAAGPLEAAFGSVRKHLDKEGISTQQQAQLRWVRGGGGGKGVQAQAQPQVQVQLRCSSGAGGGGRAGGSRRSPSQVSGSCLHTCTW
jgi:hypothetical protein